MNKDFPISGNHCSHEMQVDDALVYLRSEHYVEYMCLFKRYPEIGYIAWQEGESWFDTDAMGVDVEWSSWLTDAIEDTGLVIWSDGEPYATESEVAS